MEENDKDVAKRSSDKKIIMDQLSLQKLGGVVQNNGRITTRAIRTSSGLALPSETQRARVQRQSSFTGGHRVSSTASQLGLFSYPRCTSPAGHLTVLRTLTLAYSWAESPNMKPIF